ncbi:MAG: endonuclease/exonuclease/phosphatase family protein [Acidimicrobiales bacterium]
MAPPLPPDCHAYGNAILSRLPFTNATSWDLSFPAGEQTIARKVLRTTVIFGSRPVFFYTTHLSVAADSTDAEKIQQVTEVIGHVQEDLGEGNPANATAIVTGEFNERPDHVAIAETMAAMFDDAWVKVHGPNGGLTGCLDGTQPTCRIDYIFVARDTGISPKSMTVDDDASLSDHLSTYARFE